MVIKIREAEELIGEKKYDNSKAVLKGKKFAKSIYVSKKITKGECFTTENIKVVRPGFGLHPKFYEKILGKKSTVQLDSGERLKKSMVKNFNEL
jgi:pseudaminic acid synthase